MGQFEPLREIARLYVRQQRESVACCAGTSLTECWIVTELGRSGGRSLTELSRAIGFDKSWTSRTVDALAGEGLIAKEPNPDDGRGILLTLTPRGRRRFENVNRTLDAHARQVMKRVPASRRKAVLEALALVHEALLAHAESGLREAASAC